MIGYLTIVIHVCTVKHVLSSHSKIDKTKVLKTGGSLVQVKSIAECSSSILQIFRPAFNDYRLENVYFLVIL